MTVTIEFVTVNVFMSFPLIHVMPEMKMFYPSTIVNELKCMAGNKTYSYRASKEKPSTSWKDKAFPTQLGKANPRSLGTRGCTGFQGAFHLTTLPKAASKASRSTNFAFGLAIYSTEI